MKTTLNQIRSKSPCEEGWKKLLASLGKTKADDEPVSIITILDSNGLDDALWCFQAVEGYDREIRLFGVWCARQVQNLMTDQRSINALAVSERFANGEASEGELSTAAGAAALAATGDAAGAIARATALAAARAATGDAALATALAATRAAARAAALAAAGATALATALAATRAAARAAALAATGGAARAATLAAAGATAGAATLAATLAAAGAAAGDAAGDAARAAQIKQLRVICTS